ncbi:MAG: hypothetical protein ACWA6X_09255 [Bauldia sp.]
MARRANLWGTGPLSPAPTALLAGSDLGAALLAIAQPDLFGPPPDRDGAARLLALRRRRGRARRRAAAMSLLTAQQEAAAWHAEEAMAEDEFRRDAW